MAYGTDEIIDHDALPNLAISHTPYALMRS